MNETYIQHLMNYGLSDKESKVYLALLELQNTTVFEVAKQSGINRSTAYVTLESLKKKGLVGVSDDKKVRHYVATSPEILIHSATRKAKKHEDILTGLNSIIPDLKALHKDSKRKPIVKVFEGKNGLINLLEDTLNSSEKEIRVVSAFEPFLNILGEYLPHYAEKRIHKKIRMHGIHPYNNFSKQLIQLDANSFDKSVLIPESRYKYKADFAVYDNKISYMTPESGGFGVILESQDMADVMKNVFDMAYEQAKRLNEEIEK